MYEGFECNVRKDCCFVGNEFLSAFESRFIEALTICAKNTFEMIKTRANPTM